MPLETTEELYTGKDRELLEGNIIHQTGEMAINALKKSIDKNRLAFHPRKELISYCLEELKDKKRAREAYEELINLLPAKEQLEHREEIKHLYIKLYQEETEKH